MSRILATLEREHVVERDEASRTYRLGLGLIAVAGSLLANLDVRRVAMEDLQALTKQTQETVALAIWDGAAAVTVEQISSTRQIEHTSALGSRYTTGLSASVQVPLAYQDPDHVRSLIASGEVALDDDITVPHNLERHGLVHRNGTPSTTGGRPTTRSASRPPSCTPDPRSCPRCWPLPRGIASPRRPGPHDHAVPLR